MKFLSLLQPPPPKHIRRNQRDIAAPPNRRFVVSSFVRDSRNGGGFDSELIPESKLQGPSLLEFVTSERVKVVAMLGLALALCNADRVVMSVAIIHLSKSHVWTQSFASVVQMFPQIERSRAVGLAMAGFNLGSAIGLLISPIIMSKAGIFGPFMIFGLFGFFWVLILLFATSSTPVLHPSISGYDLDYIIKSRKPLMDQTRHSKQLSIISPFKKLLSKLPYWALISANAMHSWVIFSIDSPDIIFYMALFVLHRFTSLPFSKHKHTGLLCHSFMDASLLQHCMYRQLLLNKSRALRPSVLTTNPLHSICFRKDLSC